MPQDPILYREAIVGRTPNGALERLPFNLVDTPSGGGVEPRHGFIRMDGSLTTDPNVREDEAVNRYSEIDQQPLADILQLTSGLQTPTYW